MDTDFAYLELERLLSELAADIGPAECHGMLCGMLCLPGEFDRDLWIRHALGYDEHDAPQDCGADPVWDEVIDAARSGIDAPEGTFRMMLADEERTIAERAASVAAWCRGFLSGLGVGGEQLHERLGGDATELLRDLDKIARMDERVTAGEDNERALTEVVEYVRMGVLLLREEVLQSTWH